MARKKDWREGEFILTFHLNKIIEPRTELMKEWTNIKQPNLVPEELYIFEKALERGKKNIPTWSEEDLKMKFISYILDLGQLTEDKNFTSFFEKKLSATVQGHKLSVVADFVIAKGMLDYMEKPYFHFQEHKPNKNPTGDSMAQLLEAFLIAQQINQGKALYGCEVNGGNWVFVIMEGNEYCISKNYDSTDREELLQIIAILRKFREILETRLLK